MESQIKDSLVATEKQPWVNPYPVIGLGVAAVSFASVLIKLSDAPPLIIAFYRMGFTCLIIIPLALGLARAEFRRIGRRDLLLALGSGFLLALHFGTWITSLRYTSVASSTVLVTTQPIFVILGSYLLFREKFPLRALGGMGLAFLGSALVGFNDFRVGGEALRGDALALAGAVTFAGYLLIGRGLRQRLSLLPYTSLVYGTCTLVLLVFCLLARLPLYPYSPANWLIFLALTVLATLLGHTVFNWAVKYVAAPVIAVSILGEPVGATLLAFLFLREVPTWLQMIGGVIILRGIGIFIRWTQIRAAEPAAGTIAATPRLSIREGSDTGADSGPVRR